MVTPRELLSYIRDSVPVTLHAVELARFISGVRDVRFCDISLPDSVMDRAAAVIKRYCAGEPVAYIIGEWDFYGLSFTVNPSVLIPRCETESLVTAGLNHLKDCADAHLIDMCCGSGAIGIAAAVNCPDLTVTLCDISDAALDVTRENVARHGLSSRVQVLKADALDINAFNADFGIPPADVILSNPPYCIPGSALLDYSVTAYEPALALYGGSDGMDFYRAAASGWYRLLKPGGFIACEFGCSDHDRVRDILAERYINISITNDLADIPRVASGYLRG